MTKYDFLDGERVRKAHSVRNVPPVFQSLAISLTRIPDFRYIKIFPRRIAASNVLSDDGKKNPVVIIGDQDIVGVELLIVSFSTRSRPAKRRRIFEPGAYPADSIRPPTQSRGYVNRGRCLF